MKNDDADSRNATEATMKTYKRYRNAKVNSNGQPILSIRQGGKILFIVGVEELTSIELINPDNAITANVIASHLDRLGNANWATPRATGQRADRARSFSGTFVNREVS